MVGFGDPSGGIVGLVGFGDPSVGIVGLVGIGVPCEGFGMFVVSPTMFKKMTSMQFLQ